MGIEARHPFILAGWTSFCIELDVAIWWFGDMTRNQHRVPALNRTAGHGKREEGNCKVRDSGRFF